MRPRDGGEQRAVAFLDPSRPPAEQSKPLVQAPGDLGRGHGPDTGGGQLDGQGDPVQVPADVDHRGHGAVVEHEAFRHGRCPFHEQAN
jgi:hypothetical protein